MRKKKAKYGVDPIIDKRNASQKRAWESTFDTPIVTNPNQQQLPAYDQSQSYREGPTALPDQYYTSKTDEIDTGIYDLHPAFSAVNTLALATNGIADAITGGKNSRAEKLRYIQSLQNRFRPNNPVLNDQPMYMAEGGTVKVDNNVRSEWNKYIQWLSSIGKKGATELDTNDGGFKMLDEYKKANPQTILNRDYITPIQQDFQKYRDWAINQHKQGKMKMNGDPGDNYSNFMPELSIVDGYPGSKTTSHSFPNEYLQTLNEDGVTTTQNKGFAANMVKMPYGGGPLTAEGAKEMLKDGTAHGKKLTAKQKRYFGYIAGGGKPKAKYGVDEREAVDNGGEERVEAEGGENYTDQNDNVIKIPDSYPSHEQGGVPLNDVDRVLEDTSTTRKDIVSKALKVSPDTFQAMFGFDIKKPVSHAKALDKAAFHFQKQSKKVETGLKKGTEILDRNSNDYLANNSLKLNVQTLQSIPNENHVFDLLFQHQENVKDMLGVQEDKAKYGKYVPKAAYGIDPEDIDPYPGGKTKKGATTPTGKNNAFNKNKDTYKAIWKKLGIDPDSMTNAEFQSAAYDYILKNNPEVARNMWKTYGNTAKGIKQKIGSNYDFNNLSDEQLHNLKSAYVDGLVGVRTLEASLPPEKKADIPVTPLVKQPDQPVAPPIDNGLKLRGTGKPSRFNEPLRWYDVAGPLMSLTDSERIPANYNPVELNEVRLKQQNPTPALEAGNRDFNAVLDQLPNTGAGMANATNAFSSKYSVDNQILGQYENANSQIKNQETMYNANVRDRQSAADQQSRAVFEQQVLGGKEAQRQQKLKAFDDLFTRVALNRKLNREGNLIMQLTPNFNQYGEYNGNQRYMVTNTDYNDNNNGNGVSYITDPKTGKQYPILRDNGRLQNKSKILSGLPKQ